MIIVFKHFDILPKHAILMMCVKLQLYAKGLAWARGKAPQRPFFYFPYVKKQKHCFQPIFLIGICPM